MFQGDNLSEPLNPLIILHECGINRANGQLLHRYKIESGQSFSKGDRTPGEVAATVITILVR